MRARRGRAEQPRCQGAASRFLRLRHNERMARVVTPWEPPAPAAGERRAPPWLGLLYVGAYLVLDWASFIDPIGPFAITPWNPPPGLSLAFLLAYGTRQAVWLFVAALLAEFVVRGGPAPFGTLIAASAVLSIGYTALAVVLRRLFAIGASLETLRDAALFAAVSAAATGMIAFCYIGILVGSGSLPSTEFWGSVTQFWLGDLIGIVVTTPFLLVVGRLGNWRQLRPDAATVAQALAILLAVWLVFGAGREEPHKVFYVLFLPLIWIAMRHGVAGTAIATLAVQLLLIGSLAIVRFPAGSLLDYQFLMLTLAGTGLILGAAVSERRRIARELREKQFELDRSLRLAAASELASAMAHELQQPLTALGNYVRASAVLAGRGEAGAAALGVTMQKAIAEADRAGHVVRRLRDFFRGGTVNAEPLDAASLALMAADAVRERAARHAVAITVAAQEGLPPVRADRLQIEGVLQNLLSNAIDALKTVAAPRTIAVDVRHADAREVQISIEDNGPGVGPEMAERLFGHFATSKPYGMGLGLAIARSVIEAHGGRIWYEPRSPGSAFRFTLPVVPSHD